MIGSQDSIIHVPTIEIYSHLPTTTTTLATIESDPSTDIYSIATTCSSTLPNTSRYMELLQVIMLILVSFVVIFALLFGYIGIENRDSESESKDDDDDDDVAKEESESALDDLLFNENKFAY